jgi:hypothetical protein
LITQLTYIEIYAGSAAIGLIIAIWLAFEHRPAPPTSP